MQESQLDEYIRRKQNRVLEESEIETQNFNDLCQRIKTAFFDDWQNQDNSSLSLEIQRKAIIGYEKEKDFFKNRIYELLKAFNALNTEYPTYYVDLVDAIYNELWGLAGMAEWFYENYKESSSAKIIGENIFFMIDGKMKLMPQKISEERKAQLIKAIMLATPEERMDKDYYEMYMLDGTRVTVFIEPMAKKSQACLIFRRYIIPSLSFEEQARRGTIPEAIIPALKSMVSVGYNVIFMGAVRTAKTTFLSTWQSYEDPNLEGVMVETDPEIPLHNILPNAPIIQLIADGQDLSSISKNLLRSDADYFIMAEARDGIALDTAMRIASKGTKRMKITVHSRNPYQLALEAAMEISNTVGGNVEIIANKFASSFDYIFHFIQLKDKSQKRLKGIYEMTIDAKGKMKMTEILSYDVSHNTWSIVNKISDDKKLYGLESNEEAFKSFRKELKKLSELGVLS